MTEPIKVILLTGFLGSGKTTLLNHLITALPPQVKLAVLMNEFAEIGVDAALVERKERLEVVEVRKGSIFCVCAKKEFLIGLSYIAERLEPDFLFIEATGVANPADIRKDLCLNLFKGRFRFMKQICLVDAVNFEAAYHVYTAVERQIATSDLFILNKSDLVDSARLQRVRELIAAHHPAPRFVETILARVPVSQILALDDANPSPPIPGSDPMSPAGQQPPDRMASVVYAWQGRTRAELETWLAHAPDTLPRLKGFVDLENETFLLEGIMGRYTLTPANRTQSELPSELRNRIVCIAAPEKLNQLAEQMDAALWVRRSGSSPFLDTRG